MRRLSPLSVVLSLSALAGCENNALSLVEVRAITPTVVEASSRLEIKGGGFPVGREARVTFVGALYRAGFPAVDKTDVSVIGKVANAETIRIDANDALVSEFCKHGSEERHATFDGVIRVAFASPLEGAGLVQGESPRATLDVFPRHLQRAAEAKRDEAAGKSVSEVGMTVQLSDDGEGGAIVTDVTPFSLAATSGVVAGERIVEANHVHVTRLLDLAPSADGTRDLLVAGGVVGGTRHVVFEDTSRVRRWVRAAKVAAAWLSGAALFVLLFLSRYGGGLTAAFPAWAPTRRAASRDRSPRFSPAALKHERLGMAIGLLTWCSFGVAASVYPAWRDRVDPPALLLACMVGATATAANAGGRRWLAAAGMGALSVTGSLLNTVSYFLLVGAIHMRDVLLVQQGGPRGWVFFQGAPSFILGISTFLALMTAAFAGVASGGAARRLVRSVTLAGGAVLFAQLFLGGGDIASVAAVPDRGDVMLFAGLLGVKATLVAVAARHAAGFARQTVSLSVVASSAFVVSVLAFAIDALAASGSQDRADTLAVGALVAAFVTLAALALRRLAFVASAAVSRPRLNPFL